MSQRWHWLSLEWLKLNTLSGRCTKYEVAVLGIWLAVHVSQQKLDDGLIIHHTVNYGRKSHYKYTVVLLLRSQVSPSALHTVASQPIQGERERFLLCFSRFWVLIR
jgi:hypothetical protein